MVPGPLVVPPPPSINHWFTEPEFQGILLNQTSPPFPNFHTNENLQPYTPPPPPHAYAQDAATTIEVGSSPAASPPRKRVRMSVLPSKHVPRSPSPAASRSPSPKTTKIPNKRKGRKSASKGEIERYALYVEIPQKRKAKKAKLEYKQHGPWEFQTQLSWEGFCTALANEMHCTAAALDTDSFSWRSKQTGASAGINVRNTLGYQQMISYIRHMPSSMPNIYLVMNPPRPSGKHPVNHQ